jgi:hypothetical protein
MSISGLRVSRTQWSCALLLSFFAGCSKPEPIIGIKFPDPPPTKPVDGPGFTVEINDGWTSRIDGSKLIVTTKDRLNPSVGVIELLPYEAGEDSSNVLDKAQKKYAKTKTSKSIHKRVEIKGLAAFCRFEGRFPATPSMDSGYYIVAAPGKKIVAGFESPNQKQFFRDVNQMEAIVRSFREK